MVNLGTWMPHHPLEGIGDVSCFDPRSKIRRSSKTAQRFLSGSYMQIIRSFLATLRCTYQHLEVVHMM